MTNNLKTYILSGGKSSRFGENKLLFPLNGKPVLQYVIDAVSSFSEEIILVGNSTDFSDFKLRILSDTISNLGPISGIHAILCDNQNCDKFIIAGDMPFLEKKELDNYLKSASEKSKILIAKTDELFGHNLHVFIKKEWNSKLLEILNQNPELKSVHKLWEKFGREFLEISEDGKSHYRNVNEKSDLRDND